MAQGGQNTILVQLNEPYHGQTMWLFGSKKAIYDYLPVEVVGIGLTTLQNRPLPIGATYANRKCTMYRLEIMRSNTRKLNKRNEL